MCSSLFLIKLQTFRPAVLLKRDSNTGLILRNLRIFLRTLFFSEHVLTVTGSVCSENLGEKFRPEQLTNIGRGS